MLTFKKIALISSITLFSISFISGCKSGTTKTIDSPAKQILNDDGKEYTAQQGLSTRQRFGKALQYLENGQIGQAAAELKAYIANVPTSSRAKDLLVQITTDPSKYFPKENFPVKLTSGESLSTLSKEYLGTALKFYALARYNNIENPSKVNIGQTINIPLTKLAIIARTKSETTPQDIAPTDMAVTDTAKVVDEAKRPIADTKAVAVKADEAKVTEESILAEITALVSEKKYQAAATKLEELEKFGDLTRSGRNVALTFYMGIAKLLSSNDKVQASDYYTKAGDINLINGDNIDAFDNFKSASDLDSNNARATEDMLVLQRDISEKYHREASTAYRNQDLDIAIKKWDIVLKVDTAHDSAQRFRAQAIELKDRLSKIKN
jgi:tetratricopeptide (TPR) repeat protein